MPLKFSVQNKFMNIKPKHFIISLFILLGGVDPSIAEPTPTVDPKVLHIINRLSFGPSPGEVQRVESIGVDRYIQEQLSPDSIPEPQNLTNQLSQLKTLKLNPVTLYRESQPIRQGNQKPSQEEMKAARDRARLVMQQAVQARLLRATESPRQLQRLCWQRTRPFLGRILRTRGNSSLRIGSLS